MIPENCSSHSPRSEPKLTENGRKVLRARYLKKNEAGECVETPADLFERVAATIAEVETLYGATDAERQQWSERYYRIMASGDFMPNSPTLMNAGREMGMLSACFVLPVRDSIVDIFDSIKHTALIQKAGGGTGFAFDELRPTGDFIASSGGTTSGPITFWRAFSEATNAIQQGAFRRGANMGMMYIHHPDILKFLHAKQDLSQFTNYNISVKVTDDWMDEYLADPDSPHIVRNPRNGKAFVIPHSYKLWESDIRALIEVDCVEPVSPAAPERYYRSPRATGPLPAELRGQVYTKREIWDIIVRNAWQTGEPGVVFIDRINEHNPTPHVGRIEATNPCGEQPLLPYEACNLGSINLGAFVAEACTPQAQVDWERLKTCVHVATRFLDNVIDANNYPLDEIDHICKANRKIGLGVMGFADALYRLNVPYNSEEGVAWGERLMKFVNDEAHAYSEHLARTRGCFPNWKGSLWHARNRMMRNSAVTTVAPTGTISIIANCSGGIEPMFSLAFIRNVLKGQKEGARPLVEVNETFEAVARQRGIHTPALMERLAAEGTLAHIEGIPEDIRRVFVCAHDITPEWHMRMQAAFQRHCDSSISKTINFPQAATRDDVEKIYRLAYDLRCKGVTVYRDGCRECQPMALTKEGGGKAEGSEASNDRESAANGEQGVGQAREPGVEARSNGHEHRGEPRAAVAAAPAPVIPPPFAADAGAPAFEPRDLPEIVSGLRIRQMTPFGNMHVKITVDPRTQRELEVFAQLGKGGDVANSDLEGMCRTGSLWLRAGGSLRHLIKQWDGIGSSLQIPTKVGRIMSLPDGLACALKKYVRAKERFGLRALLLGEIDLAELDRPAARVASDRALGAVVTERTSAASNPPDRVARVSSPGPAREARVPDRVARVSNPCAVPSAGPGCEQGGNGSAAVGRNGQGEAGGNGGSNGGGGNGHGRAASATSRQVPSAVRVMNPPAPSAPGVGLVSNPSATGVGRVFSPSGAVGDESCDAAPDEGFAAVALATDVCGEVEVETDGAGAATDDDAAAATPERIAERLGSMDARLIADHDPASGYKLICPECHARISRQEGCACCKSCGWAAC